ncbi:MAG: DUF2586 family protein [Prevotellaceae bacterium]|jgi:hypothetical protein|nr:DUF2586 family protein [Prevotellaceae bacterium]
MLSRVKILFENGALGSVVGGTDGVAGMVITAAPVTDKFELAKPYILRKVEDLAVLGITSADSDANAFAYRHVKEFYAEAGEGAELWLMGFPNTETQSDIVDKTQDTAKLLIEAANGRLRAMAVGFNPALDYTPTISNGLDADLAEAMLNAQELAEWATNSLYAPLFILLEAREFNGTIASLPDLTTHEYNRVGVILGDTVSDSRGSATGLLLGRTARIQVQRHVGRVRDGALNILTAFIGDKTAETADVESINDKGFITFRTFTGRSGYYLSDDCLATKTDDDYRSIARRRTIDKAYRIAYETLLDFLNDEIPVTDSGELVPAMVKSWETEVETAIISQMTNEGNLGVDSTDAGDTGVKCYIDYAQNVVATGKIEISLKVKPYGYAKYIDVKLGFITVNGQ